MIFAFSFGNAPKNKQKAQIRLAIKTESAVGLPLIPYF